ncbi:DEAD/DEAH box helicase [Propionibacteriaceae bacterium Y1923]|uniref:DEAD/DEAH box helicase n=1 Tax=Aestuariimicrobium sp. Y1814 TaxID=3418742 RepID=UPI003C2376A8
MGIEPTTADALAGFSAPTKAWFSDSFAAPTAAQSAAWSSIGAGKHTLLVAPTGSGKTLAAFLSSLDRLSARSTDEVADAREHGKVQVLYVSPLKALASDVARNLTAPLRGIQVAAERLGSPSPDITVAIRSGDSSAAQRRQLAAHPPDVLITTPESLFLMLSSQSKDMFDELGTVIVDEVHALAGTKRGVHLQLSLERLDQLGGRGFQRIGLSATVEPPAQVARFLAGDRPVEVLQPAPDKQWDLSLEVPVEDMTDLALPPGSSEEGAGEPNRSIWPFIEQRLLQLIDAHRTTLCFVNSRRVAERLTAHLNELHAARLGADLDQHPVPPAEVMAQSGASLGIDQEQWPQVARAHHGSVSKQRRAEIEQDLKSGRLACVVATSSLELGIDMGSIDLVVQVSAPPSVSSGLQRVGRAGHQVGAVSAGVMLPTHRSDLLEATVVTHEMLLGRIEPVRQVRNPLDVLAQHLVSMTIDQSVPTQDAYDLVRRCDAYAQLSRPVFDGVVDMLAGRYPSEEFAELRPRLVHDRVTGTLSARPGARRLVTTSGGTIPDRGLYGVFLVGEPGTPGRRVGELDEEMVHESRVGDVFTLGTTSWRVEEITPHQVLVTPAPGQPGRLPFWKGEQPWRPSGLGVAIGRFVDALAAGSPSADRALATLDENAAQNLRTHLAEQRAATGELPGASTVLVERFRDELGDWRVVVHCPWGAAVLTPWALAIEALARREYGGEVRAWATNDGIVVSIPDSDRVPGLELLDLDPEQVHEVVTDEVYGSALFAARFRECATRALLLPRLDPGRRTPLWRQRQRAAQLLEVASRHADFPIVLETLRECLDDVFDMPGLRDLLAGIQARTTRLVLAETERPSPFARNLMFGYVGEFLYDSDQPLAERRLAALNVDAGLLAELLGREGSEVLLDPAAVARVEADLQRTSEPARAATAEQLWDIIRMLGPLDPDECGERADPQAPVQDWVADLVAQRRLVRVRVAGRSMLCTVDDIGVLRDGLGVPAPPGFGEQPGPGADEALARLVLRQLLCRCGVTPAGLAERWGLAAATVHEVLQRLREQHQLVLLDQHWWHPDVLARVKRRTLAILRAEVEPVEPAQLARFLVAWHELDAPAAGPDALLAAVDSLAGWPVPASMLESVVLPARVEGYQPHLLDQAIASGEVVWSGRGAIGSGDGWVQLWPADLVLPDPPEQAVAGLTPAAAELWDRLGGGGAWTLDELAGGLADPEQSQALWELVWAGLVTSDSLQAVRDLGRRRGAAPALRTPTRARMQRRSLPRMVRMPRLATAPGRWSRVVPSGGDPVQRRAQEATIALHRHGVLTRGAVAAEPFWTSFQPAYQVLVGMEDQGLVRRGHVVAGLGAAQFALPGAIDRLRACGPADDPECRMLAACDPANPYGAALAWPPTEGHRPARRAGALVVLRDGMPVLYVERGAHSLLGFREVDRQHTGEALAKLAALVRDRALEEITVHRADGAEVLGHPGWAPLLEAAGFRMTPRGYRVRSDP